MADTVFDVPKDSNSGKKIMVHDLSKPASNCSSLVDFTTIAQIPTPQISIEKKGFGVKINDIATYGNAPALIVSFKTLPQWILDAEPELFLYTYRNKTKRQATYTNPISLELQKTTHGILPYDALATGAKFNFTKFGQNKFVHTQHLNGSKWIGSRFWTGQNEFTNRETEWTLTLKRPEDKQHIAGFKPWIWWFNLGAQVDDTVNASLFPLTEQAFTNELKLMPGISSLKKRKNIASGDVILSSKTMYYKIGLAIKNPDFDSTHPTKKYNIPKIIGPLSETFAVFPRQDYVDNGSVGAAGKYITGWDMRVHSGKPGVQ